MIDTELGSDAEFLAAVDAGHEPVGHRSNLRLGWLLVSTYGPGEAYVQMMAVIRRRAADRGGVVCEATTAAWIARLEQEHDGLDRDFGSFIARRPWLSDSRMTQAQTPQRL